MNESEIMWLIQDCVNEEGIEAVPFEQAGVMTRNKGLVLKTPDGSEFQLTIVKSN